MSFRAAYPFVLYVFWLMSGILAAIYLPARIVLGWPMLIIFSFCYLIGYLAKDKIQGFKLRQGILGGILLFSLGFALTREKQAAAEIKELPKQQAYWLVEAESDGIETLKTVKVQAKIIAHKNEKDWERSNGRLMLYIKKEGLQFVLRKGDSFVVKALLTDVPEPLNPSAFNYKEYLAGRGIHYQSFVQPENIQVLNEAVPNSILAGASQLRNKASAIIEKWVEGEQEAAICKALVLGARESLDEEIKQAYATSGAMHVLAVSGLHVGFVYVFLNFLFRYGWRNPYIKWVSFACVVAVLWSYAILTGLSPSVIRAAWMFSMLDLALKMKRKSGTYNALAVAAFALLVFDPYNLKSVGFQLSFLAVAGIVYIVPRLSVWYKGDNKFIRYLWGLLAVSLAAQLATFPLGLYYFGQFPTYFFITNLLVVPAAGLILILGFGLLFSSLFSNVLAEMVGWCLNWLMEIVNGFIFFVEGLPYSKLSGLINEFQLFLLAGIILGVLFLLHFKKFYLAALSFLFLTFFLGSLFYTTWIWRSQRKLIIYHVPAATALQLVEGREAFFLADRELPPARLKFQVQPHRAALGFSVNGRENSIVSDFKPGLYNGDGFALLVWRGIRLLYIYQEIDGLCNPEKPVPVDYILLSKNSVKDLNQLQSCFKAKKIIIDGSNQTYLVNSLRKQAEELNILCHITAEKGAFELNLSSE